MKVETVVEEFVSAEVKNTYAASIPDLQRVMRLDLIQVQMPNGYVMYTPGMRRRGYLGILSDSKRGRAGQGSPAQPSWGWGLQGAFVSVNWF